MKKILVYLFATHLLFIDAYSQQKKNIAVIGYFAGPEKALENIHVQKLTHLIFSFCHLKEGKFFVDNAADSACIQKMVSFKQKYPSLKIILSLGGWGGCKDCSPVFSSREGRNVFARSVKDVMQYFQTDGIDLDWEYPAITGHPGHPYSQADKKNFTSLIKALRKKLGSKYELSFAAGGFELFIDSSIEWKK